MTEVWFYHLQRETLENALPPLLQKTLERGWRAVVRAGGQERVDALDAHLWTFRADAVLPHGRAADGFAPRQPIYLTAGAEMPNGPHALFLVDGAAQRAIEKARFMPARQNGRTVAARVQLTIAFRLTD